MATHKYIYWRDDMPKDKEGRTFVNVHLLVGYNQGTITDFQEMASVLRQTFPEAKDSEICCGKVHKSSFVDNHSIITWTTYLPQIKDEGRNSMLPYEDRFRGWHDCADGRMEYYW